MKKLQIAFYIGSYGNWKDKLICLWTFGRFSHCELVYDGYSYSSSGPDNGVRRKEFKKTDEWILVSIPNKYIQNIDKLFSFFEETKTSKYDWIGLFFKFILNKNYPNKKYYCSEWCAICLNNIYNIDLNYSCSPTQLYNQLRLYRMPIVKNNT